MVSPLGPSPGTNEQSQVAQNLAIQQLLQAVNKLFPVVLGGYVSNVDLNSANTDNAITIASVPANYAFHSCLVKNKGTTASITTATAGLFTAISAGGTALANNQSLSGLTSNLVNTSGGLINLTLQTARMWLNPTTIYFRVGTAQGAAATADVYVYIRPLP